MIKRLMTLAAGIMLAVSCTTKAAPLAQTPPMGWNSFDSYGVYLYEDAAMKNLDAFIEKLSKDVREKILK